MFDGDGVPVEFIGVLFPAGDGGVVPPDVHVTEIEEALAVGFAVLPYLLVALPPVVAIPLAYWVLPVV